LKGDLPPPHPLPAFGVRAGQVRDCLYLFDHGFIFTSAWVFTGETSRFPGVLLLTVDHQPFVLGAGDERLETRSAAVGPQVPRSLDARDRSLVSVHVEPAHPAYAAFRAIGQGGVQPFAREVYAPLDDRLRACHRGHLSLAEAQHLFDALMAVTTPALPAAGPVADPRIVAALASLRQRPEQSLSELAEELKLSYDRFSHLFSEQVGLPLKSYQLWRKVKRATLLFDSGRSLTDIAHEVGFSDSAHLTRTYAHFFGIKPSYLTNSDCVQVVH
jgi:AraC-like DNA-binding protein